MGRASNPSSTMTLRQLRELPQNVGGGHHSHPLSTDRETEAQGINLFLFVIMLTCPLWAVGPQAQLPT